MRRTTGIVLAGALAVAAMTAVGTAPASASDASYCDALSEAERVAGQMKDKLDNGISDPQQAKTLLEEASTTAKDVAGQAPSEVREDWNTLTGELGELDGIAGDLASGETKTVDLDALWKNLEDRQQKVADAATSIRADAKTRCQ